MNEALIIVRSRRPRLVAQALATIAVAGTLGVIAQSSQAIRASPVGNLGSRLNLPLVFLLVMGIGVATAVVVLKESWNHQIALFADSIEIRDGLGTFKVAISDIELARAIPLGGIGIAFRRPERWLDSLSRHRTKRRLMANTTRKAYQCDVLIARKNIDVSEELLLSQIQQRIQETTRGAKEKRAD